LSTSNFIFPLDALVTLVVNLSTQCSSSLRKEYTMSQSHTFLSAVRRDVRVLTIDLEN